MTKDEIDRLVTISTEVSEVVAPAAASLRSEERCRSLALRLCKSWLSDVEDASVVSDVLFAFIHELEECPQKKTESH